MYILVNPTDEHIAYRCLKLSVLTDELSQLIVLTIITNNLTNQSRHFYCSNLLVLLFKTVC